MLNQLKFSFTADNKTAAGFRSLKNELSGVKGALAGVQDYAKRTGRAMRNIGAGMTAGVTGPALLLGKQSLSLYDQQVKAEAAVRQAILSTGGAAGKTLQELKGLAGGLQGLTTFGDEDILRNVTAPLLTFSNVQGEVFDRAQANVLDMATMLKTDLKSAAMLAGKALNDPVKGLSALSRMGITFEESQRKVIKSLVATGDMAGAQALVLTQLETKFAGQASAAAGAPLGKWDQLRNAIGDVKEELGGQIDTFIGPLTEKIKVGVGWFQQLSPEVKKSIVVFGGLAAAAGPVLAILGLVTMGVTGLTGAVALLGGAFTFMTGPVGLVIGGIGLLAGAVAALWPEKEKTAVATDILTGALGDEIRQSQLLSGILGTSSTMSVDAARTKLQEARARHENVSAIIAEHRALALGSTEYSKLSSQIKDSQAALNSLGFPARDIAVRRNAESFEQEQARLAKLLMQRQGLLKADADMQDQLKRSQANIAKLSGSLANVKDGTVTFGDAIIKPIVPTKRLGNSIGGLGSSANSAAPELKKLTGDLFGLDKGLQSAGQTLSQQLSPMFGNSFASIVNGTAKAKDALGGLAKQVIGMAANKAFTSLFEHIFGSFSWFGGGGSRTTPTGDGSLYAKGGVFSGGNVVPFARGGVVNSATAFPMRGGGTGLMGEAGPEAIMPLSRGRDGKLGVKAGGGGAVNVNVTISNYAPNTQVTETRGPDGRIDIKITESMRETVEAGDMDGAMLRRYGLRPRAMGA